MKNSTTAILAATLALGLGGWGAMSWANSHGEHGGHGDHGAMQGADHADHDAIPEDATPSTRAFMEANTAMHEGMDIDYTALPMRSRTRRMPRAMTARTSMPATASRCSATGSGSRSS
jgi:hypothetical protein